MEQNDDLKLVGKLLLASSASFFIFFFAMEYVSSMNNSPLNVIQNIYVWATAFAVVIATICVSWALGVLVTIVRSL
jgi:hypothetical protein